MRVGELADATGASPRSIRHYDRAGLLPSVRDLNGYRFFPDAAIDQVRRVRSLLDVGFNLAQARDLLHCVTTEGHFNGCDLARAQLEQRLVQIEAEIRERDQLRARVASRLEGMHASSA